MRRFARVGKYAFAGLLVVSILLVGLAFSGGDPPPESHPTPSTAPRVTVFLVDGMRQDRFEALRASGKLPAIDGLAERGVYIENGIGSFPSMTGYAFFPFVTGQDPSDSGILGLRWFDRARDRGNFRNYVGRTNVEMNDDLRADITTLFERVDPEYTSTFNSYMNRGATRQVKQGRYHTTSKFMSHFLPFRLLNGLPWIGDRVAPDFFAAETFLTDDAIADLCALDPKVQWITFASPDAHAHMLGVDTTYDDLLIHADAQIARYLKAARECGHHDDRLYLVLTDHGVVDVETNLDLESILRAETGLELRRGDAVELTTDRLDEPIAELAELDGVVAVNGNNTAYLYLRASGTSRGDAAAADSWRDRVLLDDLRAYDGLGATDVDLVETLRELDGIELVAVRGADGVHVFRGNDHALISAIDGAPGEERRYRYDRLEGDPLGYQRLTAARVVLERRAWLDATIDTTYPFAPPRLVELLEQPHSADILVTTAPGWDLGEDYELFIGDYAGGHGGLRADQLRVPWVLAGPGLAEGVTVESALAEDVGTTLYHLLGLIGDDVRVDGVLLNRALDTDTE